ncbi:MULTISPECIES: glutamate--tRNA ligase [Metallosphaera]|uniref:glutamate--tRNA ligase n=1 Tax=Metallosphaera TaxID=41980 RepID=UPI001F052C8D|nr:glutamate--tRNA ligase [Metallosphaera sedula]MCH1770594.1 glutamate--tRNA ligase [Metallosphaera sedula]MCP6728792.1 glutamate--tRNA ligase [Metallosphaera sedula]
MTMELEEIVYKYALWNAVKHNGQAQVGPVVSKVFAERPELKANAKEVVKLAEKMVAKVNAMSLEQQTAELQKYPELLEERKKEEKKTLSPLPNVKGTVVTRFAPNPDGPLHLGNARAAVLSFEYAKMYKGKFILRFDDTDPKVKKPIKEAYDWIRDDLRWLNITWDLEFKASERMSAYYNVAKVMLEKGFAYVDTLSDAEFKAWRDSRNKTVYKPRTNPPEVNLELWEKMLNGDFDEGKAVVRIKTNPEDPDPSKIDWVMLRIIDTKRNPHPIAGDKFRVWPTYNFATAVDDHEFGITHILRAKEHMTNTEKQRWVYDYMGWEMPTVLEFGRLKLEGFMMSKSKIRGMLETGSERDDPRLPTLAGLRRRGIIPDTVREIIIQVGLKVTDATISFDNIASVNRKLLDPVAKRLMFVREGVLFKLEIPQEMKAKVPLIPARQEFREIFVKPGDEIYLDKGDVEEGKVVRLMDLCNVKIEGDRLRFLSQDLESAKRMGANIIQWVKKSESKSVNVIKADPNKDVEEIRGYGEGYFETLKPGDIVQLVRYGFARVDSISRGEITMIFAHE